ncbi:hypothetical protein IG631_06407 [Alternaria alternata]|nr:hypothetical protein IG631_06407 [Alternaria alternata]
MAWLLGVPHKEAPVAVECGSSCTAPIQLAECHRCERIASTTEYKGYIAIAVAVAPTNV